MMETFKIVCPECSSVNSIKKEIYTESPLCLKCQAELDDPFVVEVNDTNCAIHINENDIPVLLDFYSHFCGPCMAMYEDYEDAALNFGLKVRFLKVNADDYPLIAREHRVGSIPTIIAYKNAKAVNRISAQLSQEQIRMWAQSLIEEL